jgi:alkanesulfonate monooxygenase SsuD/methylene tetrahydromethanopterin reductase-like flavin-dependent oxidoreductase (luciferase family)
MSTDGRMPRIGLFYDFRNPNAPPFEDFYGGVFDQVAWAEGLGFESVWVSGHHFTEDGYIPSPLLALSHIAARAPTMRLGTNLMIPGLYNPIRVAEDCAVLSIISGGRFDLGCAIGYREVEYATFGRDLKHRPSLFEEFVAVARLAWAGESVEFHGKRFDLPDVRITPVPSSPPAIFVGAVTPPAIERAARIGDGFLSTRNEHQQLYLETLEREGKDPAAGRIAALQWLVVAEDPERTWAEIGDHAVYQLNANILTGAYPGPPLTDRDDALASSGRGRYVLLDAAGAIAHLRGLAEDCPQIEDVHIFAQIPGEPLESGARRLEYIARNVLPELRA